MNSSNAFTEIDHPLIILAQVIYACFQFTLFVLARKRPAPMPQLVAISAFSILLNLGARVSKVSWFVATDIIMFWSLTILTAVWVLSVIHPKRAAETGAGDETGKSALLTSNLFDKKESRAILAFCMVGLGLFLYSYLSNYTEKWKVWPTQSRPIFGAIRWPERKPNSVKGKYRRLPIRLPRHFVKRP